MGFESAGNELPYIPFDEGEQPPAFGEVQEPSDHIEVPLAYPSIIDDKTRYDYTFALHEPPADSIPSPDLIPQLDDEKIARVQEALQTLGPRYSLRRIIGTGEQSKTEPNSPDATSNDEQ
jgi:hypothetical protein